MRKSMKVGLFLQMIHSLLAAPPQLNPPVNAHLTGQPRCYNLVTLKYQCLEISFLVPSVKTLPLKQSFEALTVKFLGDSLFSPM